MCSREYDENKTVCPCQAGCPNGCPCPDYQCPAESTTTEMDTTTTTPILPHKLVLILNTRNSNNAVITDETGKEEHSDDDFRLIFGESTEVYESCSVTWHGELYIFGGEKENKQITKLNGCTLERIGSLSFDHRLGACAVVNDQDIYLCFNYYSEKKCRKASQPNID